MENYFENIRNGDRAIVNLKVGEIYLKKGETHEADFFQFFNHLLSNGISGCGCRTSCRATAVLERWQSQAVHTCIRGKGDDAGLPGLRASC
jgi:hypothetical protein